MPDKGEQGTGRHSPGRRDTSENVRRASGRDSSDQTSREHPDKDGQIHHHTPAYARDHSGKSR